MRDQITSIVILALMSAALSAAQKTNCECVRYYVCRNGTMNTEGIGLIDRKASGSDKTTTQSDIPEGSESCENVLDVCCKLPDVQKPDDKVTPKPPNAPIPPTEKNCGKRNPDGVGFKISGQNENEAQFGEFPWMAAVLKFVEYGTDGQKLSVYQCGGALIHRRAVLTAASCVEGKNPSDLKIRAGEWDTQTKNEIFPHQDRDVESVIVHEKYSPDALYNDAAILILKTPVDLAENVDLVCLPEPNENFQGSQCFASGWGKDKFGKEGRYQVILKKVELSVVPHDTCQSSLRNTKLGKYFILNPTFICAGGKPGQDTCKGDGGGPLVCPLKNDPTRYAQAGIVSWGIGCGDDKIPGVYANVAALREWIDEKMIHNKLNATV